MILTSNDIFKKEIISDKISTDSFYQEKFDTCTYAEINNLKINLAHLESTYYMRNQLLRDSDWASMYHGVELRTPLVDITLLENLINVMNTYSVYKNKRALKLSFEGVLPKDIDFKNKIGFQTPVKDWIKDHISNKNQIANNDWFNYMKVVSNLFNKF
jgi:asparagine synthase (glutamine-hydrolysing)